MPRLFLYVVLKACDLDDGGLGFDYGVGYDGRRMGKVESV